MKAATINIARTALPAPIRTALERAGFHRGDVEVTSALTVGSYVCASDGQRGLLIILDGRGGSKVFRGSWGGSNMFTESMVNDGGTDITVPEGGAVCKVTYGGKGRTFAWVTVHPATFAAIAPVMPEVMPRQRKLLAIFCGLKSSYRKEALARLNATESEVTELVEAGLLKRNRAGATGITTAGRNARGDERV